MSKRTGVLAGAVLLCLMVVLATIWMVRREGLDRAGSPMPRETMDEAVARNSENAGDRLPRRIR